MSKIVIFQAIQFSIGTINFYQALLFGTRVDVGAIVMKGYYAFPKAPAVLEYHYQIV